MSKRRSKFILDAQDPQIAKTVRDILEETCPTTWTYEPSSPPPHRVEVPKFTFEVKNNHEIWAIPQRSYLYLNPIVNYAKGIFIALTLNRTVN